MPSFLRTSAGTEICPCAVSLDRASAMTHVNPANTRQTDLERYNPSYTEAVKTAISIPDDLFLLAEATARRLRVSRSELYAKAIAEYLKQQQGNTITERLNEVYSRVPAKLDSGLHRAQLKSLEKDSW